MNKWAVDIKIASDETISELSVIRSNFDLGFRSYGWGGSDKIIIAGSGGPCRYSYSRELSELLISVAKKYCEMLNLKDEHE